MVRHRNKGNAKSFDVLVEIWPYTFGADGQTRIAGTPTPCERMRRRAEIPLQLVAVQGQIGNQNRIASEKNARTNAHVTKRFGKKNTSVESLPLEKAQGFDSSLMSCHS